MIQDKRQIQINAPSPNIFDLIDRMPDKFPVFKFLEAKPFFFIRVLLFDGSRSAWEATKLKGLNDVLKLSVGDTMGPFTLIESIRPIRYQFSLNSLFFSCQTGYSLVTNEYGTELSFDLIAENPPFKDKIWWFFFKPFHGLFANKALRVIKEKVEHNI
jgi:hypothetical protein